MTLRILLALFIGTIFCAPVWLVYICAWAGLEDTFDEDNAHNLLAEFMNTALFVLGFGSAFVLGLISGILADEVKHNSYSIYFPTYFIIVVWVPLALMFINAAVSTSWMP